MKKWGKDRKVGRNGNTGINAILNVIKAVLSVLFPLVTYPYALHILGAESIGKVSYVNSIMSYFVLIASFGISNYAIREGARLRNHPKEFQSFFNEVFFMNIITTIIAYILLIIVVKGNDKLQDYQYIFVILSFAVLFTTFGVDWINVIFEDFLFITVRSICSHIIVVFLLFVCVREQEDYYAYAVLQILSSGIVCVSNWFYCKKYIQLNLTQIKSLKRHIKPMCIMFLSAMTISLYVNSDITMLGVLKGDRDVGLYTLSTKVYFVIKNILVAIYTVVLPKLSCYIGKKMMSEYRCLYSKLWGYLSIILIPMVVGVICMSGDIVNIFGGKEFANAKMSMEILAIALIFAIYGGIITVCLNITIGRERDNLIATIISAFLNIGLNFIFIPLFSLNGAAFTTFISEAFVMIFCFRRIPNKSIYLDFSFIKSEILNSITGSTAMAMWLYAINSMNIKWEVAMVLKGLGSLLIYGGILVLLKDFCIMETIMNVRRAGKKTIMDKN